MSILVVGEKSLERSDRPFKMELITFIKRVEINLLLGHRTVLRIVIIVIKSGQHHTSPIPLHQVLKIFIRRHLSESILPLEPLRDVISMPKISSGREKPFYQHILQSRRVSSWIAKEAPSGANYL
ncbi:hypothetical protein J6590_102428 [Homalodisca vitripennis]|nr:hypothetical protein J6590_102428 [Homalodisca vitripennis]